MRKLIVKIFIAAAFAVSLTACGKKSRNSGGGGVDGGGGDPVLATREEVVKAVNETWAMLTKSGPANPMTSAGAVLESLWNPELEDLTRNDPDKETNKHVLAMLQKILDPPIMESVHQYDSANLPGLEKLKKKRLDLREQGLCNGSSHKMTTASVSKLDIDGEICVSIQGLQKVATASLKRDILALLVHEIAHLFGYGEDDAVILQNYFLKNMDSILRQDGTTSREFYRKIIDELYPLTLLRYDVLNGKFMAQLMVQERSVALMSFNLPSLYGDDIRLAKPELQPQAMDVLTEALHQLLSSRKNWEKDNQDWKPIPVRAKDLAQIREVVLSLVRVQEVLTEYIGPIRDEAPKDFEQLKADVIKFTDPKTLTDPSLRYRPPRPRFVGY